MAWTNPTTRTTGEKITDSIWNIDLVDNIEYLYNSYLSYACVADVKAAGTGGGDFTLGAWRTRDINTEIADGGDLITILANQITLVAGLYRCHISCPAYLVQDHKAILYNITAATNTLIGTSEFNSNAGAYAQTRSVIVGSFTIAAATVFEIRHQSIATRAGNGFGEATNVGVSEVYTIAEFWRIG